MTNMVQEPGSDHGPTVPGNITRLNPADGLFLRGVHLQTIQSYAQELAAAVGTAAGSGVVYGFTATLTGSRLSVGPGLAIDPSGRALRSTGEAVLDLNNPPAVDASGNGFLVVEVGPAAWEFGNEKVYGQVCADDCSGSGSGIKPWIGEGITVSVRADSIEGLSTAGVKYRRGRLASLYFDRERNAGGPWLRPAAQVQTPEPLNGRGWAAGTPDAPAAHVPIAVLVYANGKWVLDVWTARRDIDSPSVKSIWQTRLSMRPWNVFMAQVLQFQAQMATHAVALAQFDLDREDLERLEHIKKFFSVPPSEAQKKRRPGAYEAAVEAAAALQLNRAGKGVSLTDLGFEDLPPAGYLPVPLQDAFLTTGVKQLLGEKLDYRFRRCGIGDIPQAVDEAQHRDRIPLAQSKPYPPIDILVPEAGQGELTGGCGWVAFVRRRLCLQEVPAEPAEPAELVKVYWLRLMAEENMDQSLKDRYEQGRLDKEESIATLLYPPDDWSYPGDITAALQDHLKSRYSDFETLPLYVVGVAATKERRSLAAVRASLLGASLDSGRPTPPVYAFVGAEKQEAIVLISVDDRG